MNKAKTFNQHDSSGVNRAGELVSLNPARATETRPQLNSKDPFSSLASRSLSEPAKALKAARDHDDKESLEWLMNHVAKLVIAHAKTENWKIEYTPIVIAHIAVYPYIGKAISDNKAAAMVGRDPKSYKESWYAKIITVEKWVKGWNEECNRN